MKRLLPLGACASLLLLGACGTTTPSPQTEAAASQPTPPPAVVAPPPPAPRTEQIVADLASLPRQTFAGIFQKDAPQPLWTLEHKHPLGHPAISPDGRWLVITRTGDWFRHGEWLVVIDLQNRTSREHRVPAPGLAQPAEFAPDGARLLGVVNTPRGHGIARWTLPALDCTITELGEGRAIAAALTHRQDRALVMRESGAVVVYDLADGSKRLEVPPQSPKTEFFQAGLAVSPDDQLVAAGAIHPGNEWVLWRLDTGERVPAIPTKQHLSWGRRAAFDHTGQRISLGWALLSSGSGERLFSYPGNGGRGFHYQPRQNLLSAAIGDGRSFGIVDVATGQLIFSVAHAARAPAPLGYADWAAVSPDGKTVYSANYFSVFAWDLGLLEKRKPDWLFAGQSTRGLTPVAKGARLLALGDRLDVWNLPTRQLERSQSLDALGLHGDSESVPSEKRRRMIGGFCAVDTVFGIVASGEIAETFDLSTGRRGVTLGRTEAEITADFRALLAQPGMAREALMQQGERLRAEVFPRGGYNPISLDASPDGKTLLVVDPESRTHAAALWSLETGRLVRPLGAGQIEPAPHVARLLEQGRVAVVGDDNGGLAFYATTTGELISRSDGAASRDNYGVSRAQITEILHSVDGRTLYTADRNQRVARWERFAEGWRKRYEVEFPAKAPLVRLALSPGGTRLAASLYNGSMGGSIVVLDAPSGQVRAVLEEDTRELAFVSENQIATSGIRLWSLE
jgi:WD40 repeat protein